MKQSRHEYILKLIRSEEIQTQDELLQKVRSQGFSAGPATICRDVRDLHLTKVPGRFVRLKFAAISDLSGSVETGTPDDKFRSILKQTVIHIDCGENIVVLKTYPGMAQAAGAAIDTLHLPNVLGSVAGDDTIFLVLRDAGLAKQFVANFESVIQ
ncbi:MAG: arginine repressor [Clostridia bacterium]|nr:arginine repressor [Clostridia bacterium]